MRIKEYTEWCTCAFAEDKDRNICSPMAKEACRFCGIGALYAESGAREGFHLAVTSLDGAARTLYEMCAMNVNDVLGHEAILKVYDLAIQNESQKQIA